MPHNPFVPNGLPLVSDYVLVKTVVAYRQALSMLAYGTSAGSAETRQRLEAALDAIEEELRFRGVNSEMLHKSGVDRVGARPAFSSAEQENAPVYVTAG